MARPPSSGRLLLRQLDESALPLAAIDFHRRIVFANASLGAWLGVAAEQLMGKRCEYRAAADDPVEVAVAGICPPPEAFTGDVADGFVSRLAANGQPFERRPARFVRLANESAENGVLLVVVLPASSLVQDAGDSAVAAERLHALLLEHRHRLGKRFHISQLLGQSEAMARVREQVRIAIAARPRVLVVGQPGSGREHVARTIYYGQTATIGPLAPIECSLVDAEQMQSALAGVLRRQHAHPSEGPGAALLLDVDRLRPDAQQELSGFLQLPSVTLHTLCTSRVSLRRLAAKGRFRADLAGTLGALTIRLPPLAKRTVDIPLLAQHFLEETSAAAGHNLSGFQPAAMELLVSLRWPRNIDELSDAVREACARTRGSQIAVSDLPDWIHLANGAARHTPRPEEKIDLDHFLADIEKELLARALRAARGNKSKAAQLLGINRARLLRRLVQLGLAAPLSKPGERVIFEPLPEEPS